MGGRGWGGRGWEEERFGGHRRSILNHHHLINLTPVSTHFNQPWPLCRRHPFNPLELIHNNRDSVRKAREAHLIDKAMTLDPHGINRHELFFFYFTSVSVSFP